MDQQFHDAHNVINFISPSVWIFHVAVQKRIDSDSFDMSLQTSRVLNIAYKINQYSNRVLLLSLFNRSIHSCGPHLLKSAGKMRVLKLVEQSSPLNCAVWFSQFGLMTY